jgi:hypothetical protein
MSVLHLNLKRKWFDMIRSGEKLQEYRDIKGYWAKRLIVFSNEMESQAFDEMLDDMRDPLRKHNSVVDLMRYFEVEFRRYDVVRFKNGYSHDARTFDAKIESISIGQGEPLWGADSLSKYYFVISIGQINE